MGIFSGLFRSRDKPQNRTTGSAYSFFFGSSSAGKRVNERSAMQMTAVYSCVRILAEAVARLPLHLYRYKEDGGKEKAIDHPLYLLLHDEPNPEMSSFVFRETLMTHVVFALPDLGETTTATTTEPIQTVSGDVNADGAVTLADLVMLQRYFLDLSCNLVKLVV